MITCGELANALMLVNDTNPQLATKLKDYCLQLEERNRQLKRALWLARARYALAMARLYNSKFSHTTNPKNKKIYWQKSTKWQWAARKCRAKADEFLIKEQK